MLSWSPFKNSLSSYSKWCKWATLNHQPSEGSFYAMTHPRGGIKAWPMDVSGQPWRAVFTPDPSGGQLRSSGQWCSLILPSALPCFFPPWVDPKGNPDKHPSTKLHLSLHPREPACNMYQKTFQHSRRIFIWKLLATHVLITFFLFYFIFKLYNIVLVLPNIEINLPQVYACFPPWTLLPPHTIPLGRPSAPAPSIQYRASNLNWQLISYMILYVFHCHSPKSSNPLPLTQSPKDCFIH